MQRGGLNVFARCLFGFVFNKAGHEPIDITFGQLVDGVGIAIDTVKKSINLFVERGWMAVVCVWPATGRGPESTSKWERKFRPDPRWIHETLLRIMITRLDGEEFAREECQATSNEPEVIPDNLRPRHNESYPDWLFRCLKEDHTEPGKASLTFVVPGIRPEDVAKGLRGLADLVEAKRIMVDVVEGMT